MKNNRNNVVVLTIAGALAACTGGHQTADAPVAAKRPVPRHAARLQPPVPVLSEPLPQWGNRTVDSVLASYAPYAVNQLAPHFRKAGVDYPPREVTLIGLKEERKLEVWARNTGGDFKFIRAYDIRAASGGNGPKLRQGDRQVPEGIYRIVTLNPNSNFHLSLRLDYPNEFDRQHALLEGRTQPGSDIYIHGDSVSAGCLAMGDAAIEELFVLAAHVGKENMTVVIAPHDPRTRPLDPSLPGLPSWTPELYERIAGEIAAFAPQVQVSGKLPARPDRRLR
jgi:hypothetical protein